MTLSKILCTLALVTATVTSAYAQAPQSDDPFVIRMLVDARKSDKEPHIDWMAYGTEEKGLTLWASKEDCELDMVKSREIRSTILGFAAHEIQEHGETGVTFTKPECVTLSVFEADYKKLAHESIGQGV
jgi:hypothetical protein